MVKVNVVVLGVAEMALRVFLRRKDEGSFPVTSYTVIVVGSNDEENEKSIGS